MPLRRFPARLTPLATQVEQSFASSLQHLGVDYLDAYILHGPSVCHGLTAGDWETWTAMERLHGAGKTRLLGISTPAIVQNRIAWPSQPAAQCALASCPQ